MLYTRVPILWQSEGTIELILIATGSEELAPRATISSRTVNVRVISMPSFELFEQQDSDYQENVLPDACDLRLRSRLEQAGWERYVAQGRDDL